MASAHSSTTHITASVMKRMFIAGGQMLEVNKAQVDALNVFPVPDGDTGTNMSLTMLSAAKEVSNCPSNGIDALCDAISKGALRGARGNSGVILSQILKGMSTVLSQSSEITAKNLAKAMSAGTEIAYKAVTKPKEGTILTVVRIMSEHAMKITKKSMEVRRLSAKRNRSGRGSALNSRPSFCPF